MAIPEFKAHAWKVCVPSQVPWVRIPLFPPCSRFIKEKKEYFMSLDWDLIWTVLQVVALLIIAREIDKKIRKRKTNK